MIKRFITILIGLLLITDCFADEQRIQTIFESKNGEYSVQYKKSKWILTDKSGSVKYKFQDQGFTSMTIFVSNNGKNIVVIDDNMEEKKIGNRNAIWIFNSGKLSRSYKINELLNDTCNVSLSVWHIDWCLGDFGFNDNQSHFLISTYEMTDYTFDLRTGKIISREKPEGFDSKTIIAYGEFIKGVDEQVTMKILRYISGEVQKENKVTFITNSYSIGRWRELIMIKNGKDITPDKYRGQIFLNSCF
jgi:hypothetical protein